MAAARIETSARLQRVRDLLGDGREHSTLDIVDAFIAAYLDTYYPIVRQYVAQWFSDHWPADLAWPSDIPRPPPLPDSPADLADAEHLESLNNGDDYSDFRRARRPRPACGPEGAGGIAGAAGQ